MTRRIIQLSITNATINITNCLLCDSLDTTRALMGRKSIFCYPRKTIKTKTKELFLLGEQFTENRSSSTFTAQRKRRLKTVKVQTGSSTVNKNLINVRKLRFLSFFSVFKVLSSFSIKPKVLINYNLKIRPVWRHFFGQEVPC